MRRVLAVAAWLLLLLIAAGLSTRWLDVADWQIPVVQSAFPILGCVAVACLVVALLLRRWRFAVAAALVAFVPLALAAGTLRSSTVPAAAGDETILFSNMQIGQADPVTLMRLVRQHHVDTLVLAELTPEGLDRLDAVGLRSALPYREGRTATPYAGTMVLSKHPLTLHGLTEDPARFYQPVVTVHAAHDYLLHAVHTYAPVGGNAPLWRDDLARLARWRQAAPHDQSVVMVGDFNASSAMPGFRQIADGMTDAIGATGAGWVRTWPHGRRIPPFVQLDHVLASVPGRGSTVVDAGVEEVPDTDHYAVWATLSVQPATITS